MRKWGSPFEKKYIELTDNDDPNNPGDIQKIVKTYHDWASVDGFKNYKDVPEYCASVKIKKEKDDDKVLKDYSLVPSEYIEFVNKDENVDFDSRMKELSTELKVLLKKDEESKIELKKILKELGYGIEE